MKSFRLLFIMDLLAGLASIGLAQQTITPEDAAKFIGQQKMVCGTVAGTHHAVLMIGADNSPTFLYFTFILFVRDLRTMSCHSGRRVEIILDNAKYHRAKIEAELPVFSKLHRHARVSLSKDCMGQRKRVAASAWSINDIPESIPVLEGPPSGRV